LYDVSKDRDCLENLAANPESETLIANHFPAKAFQRFCMSVSSSGNWCIRFARALVSTIIADCTARNTN
jgi:hypothetical protein